MVFVVPTTPFDRSLRVPYFTLYWLSLLSSVAILIVFSSGKLTRHFTIKSMFLSIVLNSVFNLLSIRSSPHPSKSLSVVIAAGTLAGTAVTSGCAAALVFRTWSLVVLSIHRTPRVSAIIDWICLLAPWLAFVGVFTGIAISTAIKPNNLAVFAYLTTPVSMVDNHAPRVVSVAFLSTTLVFEFWTLIHYLRRTKAVSTQNIIPPSPARPARQIADFEATYRSATFDRPFTIRVICFGAWLAAGWVFLIYVIARGRGNAGSIFQATGGLCASLIFASQRDVLEYLHILRPINSINSPPSGLLSPTTPPGFPESDASRTSKLSLEDGVRKNLELRLLELAVGEGGKKNYSNSSGGRVARSRREGREDEEGREEEEGGMSLKQMLELG